MLTESRLAARQDRPAAMAVPAVTSGEPRASEEAVQRGRNHVEGSRRKVRRPKTYRRREGKWESKVTGKYIKGSEGDVVR